MSKNRINNREIADEDLIENENHFKRIFYNAPIGIFHSSLEGKLYDVNQYLSDILGYKSPEELISIVNKTNLKQQVYVDKEERSKLVEEALKDNSWHSHEICFYRKEGSVMVAEISFKAIRDSTSSIKYLEGFIKDITKHKKAEEHFRKEVERESFLLELYKEAPQLTDKELYNRALDHAVSLTNSTIGFFHIISKDQKTIILTTWNSEALRACNTSFKSHYPIEQAGKWTDCIRAKRPIVYNDFKNSSNRKVFPEGHTPVNRFISTPIFDEDKVRFIFGVGNKIEEYDDHDVIQIQSVANELYKIIKQRHWEQALEESEMKFRGIFNNATDMITLHELKENGMLGRFIEVNEVGIKRLGYSKNELLNMDPCDIVAHDKRTEISKVAAELQKERDVTFEIVHVTKYGKRIPVEINIHLSKLNGKTVAIGISRDITERKKAEEALRISEAYYRTIFENTGTLTIIIEEDTTISLVNTEFEKFSGYSREEVEGKRSWTEFIANKDDLARMMEYHRLRRINPNLVPKRHEFQVIDKYGAIKDTFITVSIIPGTNKSLVSLLDITKRKKAEKSLKENENRFQYVNKIWQNK